MTVGPRRGGGGWCIIQRQALDKVKTLKAMFRGVLSSEQLRDSVVQKHVDAGSEVLLIGNTTRFECLIGRTILKSKTKKASLQKLKAEFEARTLKDPSECVFKPLWELADAELAKK